MGTKEKLIARFLEKPGLIDPGKQSALDPRE